MRRCLLIVNVQKGFINKHTCHIPKLIEKEQFKYENIYITQFFNPPGSFFRKYLNWDRMKKNSKDFSLAFKPLDRSIVFRKTKYTAVDSAFLEELKKKGISCVDICGIDTDACVLKTGVDLMENGIRPRILARLCASTGGSRFHEFGIKFLKRFLGQGQVITKK